MKERKRGEGAEGGVNHVRFNGRLKRQARRGGGWRGLEIWIGGWEGRGGEGERANLMKGGGAEEGVGCELGGNWNVR